MNPTECRKKVNRFLSDFELAKSRVRTEQEELEKAELRKQTATQAQEMAQQIAQIVQQRAHKQIASIVTRSLQAVFDDPYEFHICFERKRGRTEARMVFKRDGLEIDPMTASGGGVIDIAAFALRLSCLLLSRPPLRRILVMDEPFRFVSENLRGRVRSLLNALSKELEVQFLIVTHMHELESGTVIDL